MKGGPDAEVPRAVAVYTEMSQCRLQNYNDKTRHSVADQTEQLVGPQTSPEH